MATKPVEIEILLKDRLSAGLDGMQRKLDVLMEKAGSTSERVRILDTAIGALNVQLAAMKKAGEDANPDLDQSKNIAAISQVEAKIKELQVQLKALDETAASTETVPRGTEQAVKQYNGLHMSIQQIAREMPSLAMGPQMFFLAISNNLPVFTDELARARKEYDALVASGQKGTPVWKQVLSSLFSWQTALTTGIMLLVMYGNEIVDWVKGLFTAKDALADTRKAQEEFNAYVRKLNDDWRKSVAATAGENIAAYQRLAREYNALGDNMKAKKKFITDNQDAFHSLGFSVNGVTDAENLFVRNTDAVVSALVARAKAAAYEQEITDATQRYINQTEYNNSTVAGGGYYKTIQAGRNWTSTGRVPEELRGLREGIDYTTKSSQTVVSYTLTAAGAARINAQRSREAADRLKKNNEEAKRQLDSVVSRATEGIQQQTDAEQAVYDSLGLKPYDKQSSKSDAEAKKTAEQRKRAQEELNKDLLTLQRQNQDDETALMQDGTEKKLREIDNDYKKRLDEIDRQEAEFRKKNKEAGTSGLTDGLTRQQQDALQAARDNAAREQERRTSEVYLAEAQSMREYLRQYGTYQQQKLAIAEEYAEKIKNAQNEGERLSLTAERDRSLQQVEINAIKQNIDWGSVFSDFGTMFKNQLQPTIDRLKAIAGSDTFRLSGLEDQKTLYELIDKLEQSNTVWDSDIFKRVSDDIKAYQQAMENYARAVENAKRAESDYVNAQKAHEAAIMTGNSGLIQATQAAVEETKSAYTASSEQVRMFGTQVQSTTADLNSSAAQAKSMFEGLASGLQGLSSGSLQGIGDGVMQLDRLFGGGELVKNAGNAIAKGFQSLLGEDSKAAQALTEALGDSGLAGEIISAILSILDILAQGGVGGMVSSLADTVLGSVNGVLDDIFSGGIITKPLQSVIDGIGGIFDTITFGGFSSWFSSSNAKEVQSTIDRLTGRNEALRQSIEDLTDTIKGGEGTKSVSAYRQAYDYQAETNRNYLDIAKAQAGYHGSHHSWNYYWGGFSQEQIDKLSQQIGRDWNGDLWDLSPDEMKILRSNVDMWKQIQDTGKGGYGGRLTEKLDDYIDQAGKLEELEEQLNESLTQISFDSLYDSFIDTLMDMDASAEEIAGNVGEYFMRAILSNQIGEKYKERLQAWYDDFADAMKDNELSQDEIGSLTDSYRDIVEEAVALRDKLAEATGYTGDSEGTTQSGKSGSFNAMSQEQGTKLEGMFTSGLMH